MAISKNETLLERRKNMITDKDIKKAINKKMGGDKKLAFFATDKTDKIVCLDLENTLSNGEIEHFSDTNKYIKIPLNEYFSSLKDDLKTLKRIKKVYKFKNLRAKKFLIPNNPQPGNVELYIKDHKSIDAKGNYPTRAIICTRRTIFHNFLSWSEKVLHKFLKFVPWSNNDVYKTILEINNWKPELASGKFKLIKLDIQNLYPSIPTDLACSRLEDCLNRNGVLEELTRDLDISGKTFINDLYLAIRNNMITFNNNIFQQVKGLPIGSPISGLLSNFYLYPIVLKLEDFVSKMGGKYIRFVDDFLLMVPEFQSSQDIINTLNTFDSEIKFIKEGEGNHINYLQLSISLNDGNVNLDWYRKEQSSDSFLNFSSNVSMACKRANVFSLLKLFSIINDSNETNKYNEDDKKYMRLRFILEKNGYPKWTINKWFNEFSQVCSEVKTNPKDDLNKIIKESCKNRIATPKDGHCLIHSFAQALDFRYEKLMSLLHNKKGQISQNLKNFLTTDYENEWFNYLQTKKWNCGTGDIAPAIIAELLNIKTFIIKFIGDVPFIECYNSNVTKTVVLILEKDHYEVIKHDVKLLETLKNFIKFSENCEEGSTLNLTSMEKANKILKFRKPCLNLEFISDESSNKLIKCKNNLKIGNKFNLLFRSSSKILDLIKRCRGKVINIKEEKKEKPR